MHKARKFILIAALLSLTVACSRQDEVAAVQIRPVKTIKVDTAQAATVVTQIGEIKPVEETALGFRIAGRVLKRLVDVGAVVKQGDLIAELDPSDSQNQLKTAQAQLDSALSAEKLALSNLNRIKQLLPGGAVSESQLDQAQSNYEASVSNRRSAEASLSSAKDGLSFTRLLATQDGVVAAVAANQGQVVAAGQEVVQLAALHGRDAVFNVAEALIKQPHKDLTVLVSLLSDPTAQATGRIRDISPVADPVSRTYRVRVSLANPPQAFSFGATVQGSIEVPASGFITIPASALTRQGKQAAVYLVDPQQLTLHRQVVEVKSYTDTQALIAAGLKGGELVVVAGVQKLSPGQQVKLLTEPEL